MFEIEKYFIIYRIYAFMNLIFIIFLTNISILSFLINKIEKNNIKAYIINLKNTFSIFK